MKRMLGLALLLVLASCGGGLTEQEALERAHDPYGICSRMGEVGELLEYRDGIRAWVFEFTPDAPKAGCDPVCAVGQKVEVRWQCST